MVNKALLDAGRQINAERDEQKKTALEEMAQRAVTSRFPNRTFLRHNEPLFYSTLVEQVFELPVHEVWNGKGFDYVLCDKTYAGTDPSFNDSCTVCKELDDYGSPRKAKVMAFQIIYSHSAEGRTGISKTTGKEYKFHTTLLLPINPGKGGSNLEALSVFRGKGQLKPGKFVFEIKKTGAGKETVYHPPIIAHPDVYSEEFDANSAEAKAAREKFANMSEDEQYQCVLVHLKNVKWDLWGIDEPTADVVDSEKESTKPAGKKSKDALT